MARSSAWAWLAAAQPAVDELQTTSARRGLGIKGLELLVPRMSRSEKKIAVRRATVTDAPGILDCLASAFEAYRATILWALISTPCSRQKRSHSGLSRCESLLRW